MQKPTCTKVDSHKTRIPLYSTSQLFGSLENPISKHIIIQILEDSQHLVGDRNFTIKGV